MLAHHAWKAPIGCPCQWVAFTPLSRLGPWRNPFPEWEATFAHAKILGSKNRAKPPHLTIDGSSMTLDYVLFSLVREHEM
jgi:hypothetical protein